MRPHKFVLSAIVLIVMAGPGLASVCENPDIGGTVPMPPPCPDGYTGILTIVDGLPPGTTITGVAVLTDFFNQNSSPGGNLGGEVHTFDGNLIWEAAGTGLLAGFTRTLTIPVDCVMHTAPHNAGDPVQTYEGDMFSMTGMLFGDPDFCDFSVIAGTTHGLPSPGSTTLTKLPSGDFNVDSFFDINYRVDYTGCPGSILEGLGGTTFDTERFQAGEAYFPTIDHNCQLPANGGGTIDLPPDCPDGYVGTLLLTDGLPAGTTIIGEAVLDGYVNITRSPGGIFGPQGQTITFEAALNWTAVGTGLLTGFQRNLAIPVTVEFNVDEVSAGDPVQLFDQEVMFITGQLFGDPDFCTLNILAGSDFSLPGPGETKLTELPSGDFAVDSFFDISYEIEFEGCPGSVLEGLAGTSFGIDRFQAGESYFVSGVDGPGIPSLVLLYQNHPNPFNPMTVISYELPPGGGRVTLDIFDIRGLHVRNLVDGIQSGGHQTVTWNGTDSRGLRTASGVYFYALKTGRETVVRKMAIIK